MKLTRTLLFSIALLLVVTTGIGNVVKASTKDNNIESSSVSQKTSAFDVLTFFGKLLFGETISAAEQQSYNSTVSGKQVIVAPGVNSPLTLSLDLSGGLPGSFTGTIEFNSSNVITGGSWERVVTTSNPDGTTSEVGNLSGRFTGGTVNVNPDGSIASVHSAQMSVESGSGNYANISSGSGTLQGSFDNSNSPASFSGTEVLNF